MISNLEKAGIAAARGAFSALDVWGVHGETVNLQS